MSTKTKSAPPTGFPPLDSEPLIRTIAQTCVDKLGENIRVLDLRGVVGYTDAVVIVSGNNVRQLLAIAEQIQRDVRKAFKKRPASLEGQSGSSWICMDYGDVIVHVFYGPARAYYDVDHLWPEARDVSEEMVSYPDE
jgi:ribosome-associated protein